MYYVKKGYGCGLKVSLVQPSGAAVDLRKVRYIGAVLQLPGGQTMTVADINFDELTNNVFVRLLPSRELTAEGNYAIVFNVKVADNTMYSTSLVPIVNVDNDNPAGYNELTVAMALTVVNFPSNVDVTGCSPKISENNTWLVYDDELNAYVDTGVSVGYADLTQRYDGIVAEMQSVATQDHERAVEDHGTASDDHTLAASDHETAVDDHTAAGNATQAANDAAEAARQTAVINTEILEVLSHADTTLEKKVETLAALVVGIISGKILVESLNVRNLGVWGANNLIVVDSAAPSHKPDRAGQIYVDTTNNAVYKSTGNSAVSDWKTI